jgi:hypothetical protein
MTCGVYSLYWPIADAVYIGVSSSIEDRWWAHINALKKQRHHNYKITELYDKYGEPEKYILEECERHELFQKEVSWSQEFDNIVNLQEVGVEVGSGTKNPNSRYTPRKILRAFVYLYKYKFSQHKVAKLTSIPRGTLSHIVCGKAHLWLKDAYPEQHSMLAINAKYNEQKKSLKFRERMETIS